MHSAWGLFQDVYGLELHVMQTQVVWCNPGDAAGTPIFKALMTSEEVLRM